MQKSKFFLKNTHSENNALKIAEIILNFKNFEIPFLKMRIFEDSF